MRIIFLAMAVIMGVMLVVGAVGLGVLNLVLDAWPMRTAPTTAEDIALYRKLLADTPAAVCPSSTESPQVPQQPPRLLHSDRFASRT